VIYFLIVYDKAAENIVEMFEFPIERRAEALHMRRALQSRHDSNRDIEVVLLGAERYDDLRKTHSRYFKNVGEIAASSS
jgi:hypothetical protein